MLYFIGYTETQGNWTGHFNNAVRHELTKRGIPYQELPAVDWLTPSIAPEHYLNIESSDHDCWLVGWAQSPVIEIIKNQKGRKYGLVVGSTAMPFEPAVLWEAGANLREQERLLSYDKIFANSEWCKRCLREAYPEMFLNIVETGFPFDFSYLDAYRDIPKKEDLVVFNQRFALEKLHIIEIQLSRYLIANGFRVQHLSGVPPEALERYHPSMGPLLDLAERTGIEFVHNPTKEEYHQRLARASTVVTTSLADMLPSSLIEAIYLEAVPVAPRNMCFPEFVHRDNLYTPYDLSEMVQIVINHPQRNHRIANYTSERVIERWLQEMGYPMG